MLYIYGRSAVLGTMDYARDPVVTCVQFERSDP